MNDVLERIILMLKEQGSNVSQMGKEIGLNHSTFAMWKKADKVPSSEWIGKIADYLGVSVDYLLLGEEEGFYTDKETAEYTQELLSNPELKMLFDAAKDVPKDVLQGVIAILEASKR